MHHFSVKDPVGLDQQERIAGGLPRTDQSRGPSRSQQEGMNPHTQEFY
jgi:hypothetical protein